CARSRRSSRRRSATALRALAGGGRALGRALELRDLHLRRDTPEGVEGHVPRAEQLGCSARARVAQVALDEAAELRVGAALEAVRRDELTVEAARQARLRI